MTTVSFSQLTSFSPSQRQRAETIRQLLEAGLNAPAFQHAVLHAAFLDVRLEKPDGGEVTNLSNAQILSVVLTGEESGTAADGNLSLRVELYHRLFSSAIGYTDDDGVIHTREGFFNTAAPVEVAGHWLHEWSHTAGFRHDYERTSRRDQSVPYLLGELLIAAIAPAA